MNILISPLSEGSFYFRSDSTLIRALTDFYIPDYVSEVAAAPAKPYRNSSPDGISVRSHAEYCSRRPSSRKRFLRLTAFS